jgi:hypothetical protein
VITYAAGGPPSIGYFGGARILLKRSTSICTASLRTRRKPKMHVSDVDERPEIEQIRAQWTSLHAHWVTLSGRGDHSRHPRFGRHRYSADRYDIQTDRGALLRLRLQSANAE